MKTKALDVLKSLRILYAEDEPDVRTRLGAKLSRLCAEVIEAKDGQEALELFHTQRPDLIIADICMPRMGGIELMKAIREVDTQIPAVITTAHLSEEYLLEAVRLSLEDYLVKPIFYPKLMEVLQKAAKKLISQGVVDVAIGEQTRYNLLSRELTDQQGKSLELSRKEQALLELLIQNRHRLVSKEEIAYGVWEDEFMSEGALKSVLVKLRRKIGRDAIINTPHLGYRLTPQKERDTPTC
jgi:DNA-binding response OmpR family regulator